MKLKESPHYKLLRDVFRTGTSLDNIKGLFRIPFYSNAFFLMIGSVSSALLGFVFWIVAARFYTNEEVGLASAIIAAMGLVVSLSRLGMGTGLVRFLHQTGEDANSTLNTVFTIGILSSFTAAFIFVIGLGIWSPALLVLRDNPLYMVVFIVFTISSTLSEFVDNAFIAARKTGYTMFRAFIFSLLKMLLPIVLAAFMKSFGIFASWGIALMVALLISTLVFLPRAQPGYRFFFTVKKRILSDMVHFAFANYVSAFLWGASGVVFPIMVVNRLGAESNAYFYIGWAMGGVLTVIPNAISTSLFAEGSYDETQLRAHVKRSLKLVFILLIPAVILTLLIADKLLLLFGREYSQNATALVRILALGTLPMAINIIYLSIKQVEKDLKAIVGLAVFVAVMSLALAYVLLPKIGINGVGIGWLAGQSCTALIIIVNWLRGWRKRVIQ
jgi:O-antigen/teichoic acid export membrane protein